MAVTNISLTTQLLNKLNAEDVPVKEKLEVCRVVFTSHSIPVIQKEDCILDYLISCLSSDSIQDRMLFLTCLHECLSSGCMKEFKGNLRPGVVDGILKVLGNFNPDEYKIATACITSLLGSQYFQRWLSCDVSGLCVLIGSYFYRIKPDSYSDCVKILSLFLHIHRISLVKEDMREYFINSTLIPLASALSIAKDEYNAFRTKAVQCISNVILYEGSFIKNFISIMNHKIEDLDQTEAKDVKNFCTIIKKMPNSQNQKMVSSMFTLVIESVAFKDSKNENPEIVFQVFMHLCKPLGIRVDKLVSISISPVKKWTQEETFLVIGDMIDILDTSNISITIDFDGFTAQTWLISLVIGMTNINLANLTPQLLTMVKKAFNYNNLIIEPCLKIVSNIMLRNKTDSIKPIYVELMKTVFEGASKAQRFQKIITLFLPQIRDVLIAFSQELVLDEVFPKEVADAFANTILSLAHSQVLSIMKSFLFHLEHDCLNYIESGCIDSTVITNIEIISEMIIQLLTMVKIADHSTPDVVKAKFNNLMDDLGILLTKFGEVYTTFHHDNLLKAYLNVCHSYGAMKLMIEEYDGSPLRKLSAIDVNPTNLCFVHPYLHGEAWTTIITKIVEHDKCSVKPILNKLLVQKIEAVSQIEEGSDGPGPQAARLLLSISKTSWLWDELVTLSSLFEAKELVKLVRRLAHEAGHDQSVWKKVICEEAFKEDRRLVLATALRLIYKGAKMLNEAEGTVSFDIASYIHDENLLEYELSLLITDDLELEQEIQNSINTMVNNLEEILLSEKPQVKPGQIPHISFFEVLEQLPLHYMSIVSQTCLFVTTVALLYDLPADQDIDNILFDVLYRMAVASNKHGNKIFGGLDSGGLLRFLAARSTGYPLQIKFLQEICSMSLAQKTSAKQLLNYVCEPNKDDIWLTTMVIRSLMQKKKKLKDEDCMEGKPLNKEKCINRLVSLCVPILVNEQPNQNMLKDYTTILKRCLSQNETTQLKLLFPKLQTYIEIAMSDYNTGMGLTKILIMNRDDVQQFLPVNLLLDTWNHFLFKSERQPDENIIHLLLSKSTPSEFETMLDKCSEEIEKQVNVDELIFDKIVSIWSQIITCGLSGEKTKTRQEHILRLIKPFADTISTWKTKNTSVTPLFEFFTNLASSTWVVMRPAVLDLIFLSLTSIPLTDDHELILKNLSLSIETLFGLYLFRTSLVVDRIPVLFQRYRQYLNALAPCGHPNNDAYIITQATTCADKLEKFASTMAKRQRDFTRVAPYMVGDLLNIFEKHQLHPDVKLVYTNITNVFLSLCDTHGISYLESVLSPALFKSIYDNYKKYYRYIGKI